MKRAQWLPVVLAFPMLWHSGSINAQEPANGARRTSLSKEQPAELSPEEKQIADRGSKVRQATYG